MKDRKIIGKTMHFLVHNGFIFTVMIMCLVHLTLFFIMCAGAVMPLIYFNILSVAVYLACVLLCRYGHIMPAYVCILLEVTAYTITSVHYLGLNSGSCCFLWSIVPIIIYFGSYLFKGHKRWTIVLILLLNFLTYVLLYIRYADAQPVYALAQPVEGILTIFSSFVMVF